MVKILLWLGLSIACGIAYHIAGIGGFPNAKLIRRLGCSLLALGLFLGLKGVNLGFWWTYGLFFALNYLALSTYHDYLAPSPDGTGEDWKCWLATGTGYGLSALPLIWCEVHWWAIVARTLFLAMSIMVLRERTGKVFKEEFSSGFLYCISIPLLLI